MGKKFRYANGFEGFVSDAVAKILEGKKSGKVIGKIKEDEREKAPEGDKGAGDPE
jgi:hypothetical protein